MMSQLLAWLAGLAIISARIVATADDPIVVVYYEQWGTYARDWCANRLSEAGNYKGMTHVLYGFWAPGEDCKLYSKDVPADIGEIGWLTHCEQECLSVDANDEPGPDRGNFGCLKKAKAERPFKMLLSIGGWTMSRYFSNCITPESRQTFIDSILEFLGTYDIFDGVDFDWEYPIAKGADNDDPAYHDDMDWDNYLPFLDELRAAMESNGFGDKIVAGAVGMDHNMLLGVDKFDGHPTPMAELCDKLDFITLMTYDYFGGFDDITGFHSPLFDDPDDDRDDQQNLKWGAETFAKACSGKTHKLLIGLPSYGRSFGGVKDDGDGRYVAATGTTTNPDVCKHCGDGTWIDDEAHAYNLQWRNGALSYWDIKTNYLPKSNCKHYFSESAKMDFIFCKGNTFPEETQNEGCAEDLWCAYDSPESFYEKVRVAKETDLGGYTMWASADMGTGAAEDPNTLAAGKTKSTGFQGVDHYQAAWDAWHGVDMDDKYKSSGERAGKYGNNDPRAGGGGGGDDSAAATRMPVGYIFLFINFCVLMYI